MRDIRFRAWDKRVNQLLLPDTIDNFTINALKNDRYILMQYTGLRDKNVVEIYDQDYFLADGVKALIHYSVNHACWFWGSERFSNAIARRGEVIGNIYSNPELLTKEQE